MTTFVLQLWRQEVQHSLSELGIPPEHILAISGILALCCAALTRLLAADCGLQQDGLAQLC